MKFLKLSLVAAVLCGLVFCSGCFVYASGPVTAGFAGSTTWAGAIGDQTVGTTKRGKSTCRGILGFSFGDASIKEAMQDSGITKIHHIDEENVNVLGFYASHTTIVYGE